MTLRHLFVGSTGGGAATITPIQEGGTTTPSASSGSRVMASNITAGNLIVVVACAQKGGIDPFVVGDVAQSAGTATVGTWSLDIAEEVDSAFDPHVGIFSTIVTGTGSATFTVTGVAGDYWVIAVGEYNSSTGWNSSRLEDTASATGASDTPSSGDGTSAGVALFIGGTCLDNAATITEDAAFALIDEEQNGEPEASAIRRIVTTGTTDAASWSVSADDWAAALAVYKPV